MKATSRHYLARLTIISVCLSLCGCFGSKGLFNPESGIGKHAEYNIHKEAHSDLTKLPTPATKIPVSVYGFQDQTGQQKPASQTSIEAGITTTPTTITQGTTSLLVKALWDSQWFTPLEREGLQNLLAERDTMSSRKKKSSKLTSANIILEGGIIAYDSSIESGGEGAKYFGIGMSETYRVDQVTISLRAIDTKSGEVIDAVSTKKQIFSQDLQGGGFRFVKFKRILELEAGYTTHDPSHVAVVDAIETAIIQLVVSGIEKGHWATAKNDEQSNPVFIAYSTIKPISEKASIIETLSSLLSISIVDKTGHIIPGRYESSEFIVLITNIGGGKATITTTDKLSGISEEFTVSSVL